MAGDPRPLFRNDASAVAKVENKLLTNISDNSCYPNAPTGARAGLEKPQKFQSARGPYRPTPPEFRKARSTSSLGTLIHGVSELLGLDDGDGLGDGDGVGVATASGWNSVKCFSR